MKRASAKRIKKIISLILALSLMLSVFSVNLFATGTTTDVSVWDGKETAPVDSNNDGVYEIGTGAELAYAIANGGGADMSYKLTADIYLNDINKVDWTTGEGIDGYTPTSWNYENVAFQGTIDGDGYVVYGLYYNNTQAQSWALWGTGLIPRVDIGTSVSVSKLGIDYSYIRGKHGVSAFVGFAGNTSATSDSSNWAQVTINQCYVGANVTLSGNDVGAFRGVTKGSTTNVTNSYTHASITGNLSGIVGGEVWNSAVNMKNVYNTNGKPTSEAWASAVSLDNVYVTDAGNFPNEVKTLAADNMKGENVFTDATKMPDLNTDGVFFATTDYPLLRVFVQRSNPDLLKIWDGYTVTQPAGEGTDINPYKISNGEELAWAISNGTIANTYFELTDDIYLNNVDKIDWSTGVADEGYTPRVWLAGKSFSGNLDGNGHVVHGIYYNAGIATSEMAQGWDTPIGLIPNIPNGVTVTITEVGVDNMYINAKNTASPFIGSVGNSSSTDDNRATIYIDQCYAGENVDVTAFAAGAFRGFSKNSAISITNSYTLAAVRSNADKNPNETPDIDYNTYDPAMSWFIANGWDNDIIAVENCYNAVGALYKGNWTNLNALFKNNYAAGAVQDKDGDGVAETVWYVANNDTPLETANMQGKDVFANSAKMPQLNTTGMYVALAGYPELKAFVGDIAAVADGVWDGYSKTEPAGEGTEASPYLISDGAELAYAITSGGGADKYYKLTEDIYLNEVDKIDWATGVADEDYALNTWYSNVAFQGTIDGNGHVVYGLYYDDDASSMTWGYNGKGLIPRVNLGTTVSISKLGVDCSYISGKNGASAFVGFAGARNDSEDYTNLAIVNIDQCYAGASVTVIGNDAGALRGGTKGSETTITNSYSLATVSGVATAGFIGNIWSSYFTVKNCYNAGGVITSDDYMAGRFTLKNVYATDCGKYEGKVIVVTTDKMQGDDVFANALKMPYINEDNAFVATASYPVLKAFVPVAAGDDTEEEAPTIQIWDGEVATELTGEGTEASPYLISNGAELAYAITSGGGADKYYKLTNNIYLNDVSKINWTTGVADEGYEVKSWLENVAFQGDINGDGFVVYGLYSNANNTDEAFGYWGQGLIPRVNNGTTVNISNLGVDKAYVKGANAASAFVGFAGPTVYDGGATDTVYATVNIDQCYAGEDVYLAAYAAGAFRGGNYKANTVISNSYSLATIVSSEKGSSAFVGGTWSATVTVNNSYNANGTLCWQWSSFTSGTNNYATGYDEDKTASGDGLVAYRATKLDAANMQGKDVFSNADKMPNLNSTGVYVATDSYPMLSVFAKRTNPELFKVWNGDVATELAGDGTEVSPYLISNGAELAFVIKTGGGANNYYKLTSDIYLNDIKKIDWATGVVSDGYTVNSWYDSGEATAFTGTIDGDGYMVYGLYRHDNISADGYASYAYGSGLIPSIAENSSATVINLGVDYAFFNQKHGASAFVAVAPSGSYLTMDSCYAGANVTLQGYGAGALRGYASKAAGGSITNCYSLATAEGTYPGLLGFVWDSANGVVLNNCYNANGPITQFANSYYYIASTNNYESVGGDLTEGTTVVAADNMKGLDVFTNTDKMTNISPDKFVVVAEDNPALKVFFKLSANKDGADYIGFKYTEFCDYYTTEAADSYFWRYDHISANDDDDMDISDLVLMMNNYNSDVDSIDLDFDSTSTLNDITILRKALIGDYDYFEKPQNYTPYTALSGNYTYVWGDEFSGDYLDASKWSVYAKMEANPDAGMYLGKDEKVIGVEDGSLRLTAYKADDGTYHVPTSVITQNTMNYRYGYVEIRAKLPLQTGVWSSFWTKSVADTSDVKSIATTDNTTVGEVDVIEVFDRNRACGNIIKWSEGNTWYPTAMNSAQCVEVPDDDQYHIYGYEWTETTINFYYDGVLYATFDITEPWTDAENDWYHYNDETGTDMSCYNDPQYLIFNNHLFYDGVSDANASIIENTEFTSADYLIDYCRVYQIEGQEEIYTK